MRLIVSLTYYLPHVSGLTLTAARIGEDLVKKGYKVTVVCIKHDINLPDEEILNGVRVVRAMPGWKIDRGFVSPDWMIKIVKELINNFPSRLLIHLPQAEGIWVAGWAKIMGLKIICLNHCRVTLPPGRINKLIETVMLISNKLCCGLADKVLYNSADYFYKYADCSQKKVEFILPPVIDYFVNTALTKQYVKNFGINNFRVGFIGRMAKAKGLEYLIDAINLLPDNMKAKLIIIGPKNTPGEDGYKTMIQNRSGGNIYWFGEASKYHMGSIIKALSVIILPAVNSTESFGMVQAEAMKLGVPVVASDLPGVRVPIKLTGMGKLFQNRSVLNLAKTIEEVYENYSGFIKTEKAQKMFNYQKSLDEYESEIFSN